MALNEKQKRFCDEYLIDLNATQAAIRAGYSPKTANEQGARLLANVSVQARLQEALKKRAARVEITQDRVLKEFAAIGFSVASDGSDSDLKVSNKLKALELLGKHLGLFDNKSAGAAQDSNLLAAITAGASEDVEIDDLPEIE